MISILKFEIFLTDIPFRKPFKHSAAVRVASYSLFLKCKTNTKDIGFGESLPRDYVTGETRESVINLLQTNILPNLIKMRFSCFEQVIEFLKICDGKAPKDWVDPHIPQTAAWCIVDMVLLDTFSKIFKQKIISDKSYIFPKDFLYSTVISNDGGFKYIKSLLKTKIYGFKYVKLKIGHEDPNKTCRIARKILGKKCNIRVDVNMGWDTNEALNHIKSLRKYEITSFEQPIAADDIEGLKILTEKGDCDIMIDEGVHDKKSLTKLITEKGCTAVNIRIVKCGGFIAALARCQEALSAGLKVQIGCQTGESSLLSAAHLLLVKIFQQVTYGESCYGLFLLKEDPAEPVLQFGYGGKPPKIPNAFGFGCTINEMNLKKFTVKHIIIKNKNIKENNL